MPHLQPRGDPQRRGAHWLGDPTPSGVVLGAGCPISWGAAGDRGGSPQLEEQLSRLQREKNEVQSRLEEDQEDMNELMKKHKAAVAQVRREQQLWHPWPPITPLAEPVQWDPR